MRYAIITALCLALFLTAVPAQAAQDTMPPENWQADGPDIHAKSVLSDLVAGNHKKGFQILFSRGRYPKATLEKIQFDYFQMVKQQGNPKGYEQVFAHKVGTSLVRMKYVLLFKSSPMMFDLYYYNTGKDWRLKSFTISRDIKKIFQR